jgi:hypothetical protein
VYDLLKDTEVKQPDEYENFANIVDRLLSVPHDEIQRRESEYRKQVNANPNRRGPKRKKRKTIKPPSASL